MEEKTKEALKIVKRIAIIDLLMKDMLRERSELAVQLEDEYGVNMDTEVIDESDC